MKIIYDNVADWEKDFILKELLPQFPVIFCNKNQIVSIEFYKNYQDIVGDNIFVFSSNDKVYQDIYKVVVYLKPKIIIHLSDEWHNKPVYNELAKHTKLLLRQHYHENYPQYPNIGYIPLGYIKNMLPDIISTKLQLKIARYRKYNWSFVGTIKTDRKKMIDTFRNIPQYYLPNKFVKPNEMAQIYMDSIFVPNGKGNVRLDCFRLYEASLCGAIPIVVGDTKEIENTFKYEENPPWIFANNWDQAYQQCQLLLKDKKKIESIQKNIVKWWRERVKNIVNQINKYLIENPS